MVEPRDIEPLTAECHCDGQLPGHSPAGLRDSNLNKRAKCLSYRFEAASPVSPTVRTFCSRPLCRGRLRKQGPGPSYAAGYGMGGAKAP
nr:hypothetical protein GCM10017606_33070 [Microbacterium terregens]